MSVGVDAFIIYGWRHLKWSGGPVCRVFWRSKNPSLSAPLKSPGQNFIFREGR